MHTLMAVAAMYGADQRISEQFGVQYLAQRHFHMETRRRYPDIRYLRITRRWLYIWAPAATTEAVSSTVVAVYILLRFQSCRTTVANQTNMFVTCVSFNNYSHIRPTEVTSGLCLYPWNSTQLCGVPVESLSSMGSTASETKQVFERQTPGQASTLLINVK